MDDEFILNITDVGRQSIRKQVSKGGRWTDRYVPNLTVICSTTQIFRLKAKRSIKRKRPIGLPRDVNSVTTQKPLAVTEDGGDSPRARKKRRHTLEAHTQDETRSTRLSDVKPQPTQHQAECSGPFLSESVPELQVSVLSFQNLLLKEN